MTGRPCSSPGTLCLTASTDPTQGHVVIGGRPVCDDGWDMKDGAVVCRQLGYTGVLRVTTQSYYGNLTVADFSMDDVNCRGDEVSYSSKLGRVFDLPGVVDQPETVSSPDQPQLQGVRGGWGGL